MPPIFGVIFYYLCLGAYYLIPAIGLMIAGSLFIPAYQDPQAASALVMVAVMGWPVWLPALCLAIIVWRIAARYAKDNP